MRTSGPMPLRTLLEKLVDIIAASDIASSIVSGSGPPRGKLDGLESSADVGTLPSGKNQGRDASVLMAKHGKNISQ